MNYDISVNYKKNNTKSIVNNRYSSSNHFNRKIRYKMNGNPESSVLADICACGCNKIDHPNNGKCMICGCNCTGFLP